MKNLASLHPFQFNPYECLQAFIYAQAVKPHARKQTMERVFETLAGEVHFSHSQVLGCLDFFGCHVQKVIELFTQKTQDVFETDRNNLYLDCSRFSFRAAAGQERYNEVSKENRADCTIEMNLLFDKNCIPLAMKLNSVSPLEKPFLSESRQAEREKMNSAGRIIRVTDQKSGSKTDILQAVESGFGYLYCQSADSLQDLEESLPEAGAAFHDAAGKKGKIKYRYKEWTGQFSYSRPAFSADGQMIEKTLSVREKRVLVFHPKRESWSLFVTSETDLDAARIVHTVKQLGQIRKTFKTLQQQLEARPLFLESEERIYGCFLVCYLANLLEQLVQCKVFKDRYSAKKVRNYIQNFKVAAVSDKKYVNLSKATEIGHEMEERYHLPAENYYLTQNQLEKILKFQFPVR